MIAVTDWRDEVEAVLPLLGHRNGILVADMAFPLLTASGVQTVWTGTEVLTVLDFLLRILGRQKHIRPVAWRDKELEFVQEAWAPGIGAFREKLGQKLSGIPVHELPHEDLIAKLSERGQRFRIFVLKTRTCLPYTSIYLELECGYWDARREEALRAAIG